MSGAERPRVEELVRRAAVHLSTPDGRSGTGFVIGAGVVVTCAHVVADKEAPLPGAVSGRLAALDSAIRLKAVPQWFLRGAGEGRDIAFLRMVDEPPVPPVPLCPEVTVGDPLWTFGHPERSRFADGRPAELAYQGEARAPEGSPLRSAGRISGPVAEGCSGSPVLNRRTGGICGMLYLGSKTQRSGYLIGAADLVSAAGDAGVSLGGSADFRDWLDLLDDAQIAAGKWRHPGPRLRAYLAEAVRVAENHPYPSILERDSPPPLTTVYVVQSATPSGPATPAAADAPVTLAAEDRPIPALSLLDLTENCVVVGASGTGKSSLLRKGLIEAAARWTAGEVGASVPVRVPAADLAGDRPLAPAIAEAVTNEMSRLRGDEWPAEMFAGPPVEGSGWLVFVDGLDEITRPATRRAVLRRLTEVARGGGYRFIVTTRHLPDEELPRSDGWSARPYELQPFRPADLPAFAGTWFGELGVPDREASTAEFMTKIRQANLQELARLPLMATMLAQLHYRDRRGRLPTSRAEVYGIFTDLLFDKRLFADGPGGVRAQLTATLHPYGAEEQARKLVQDAPLLVGRLATARLEGSTEPLVDLLAGWTAADRPPSVAPPVWRSVLAELLRRSGLVRERRDDMVFLHQTIIEYFAARYATASPGRSTAAYRTILRRWNRSGLTRTWVPPGDDSSYARFVVAEWYLPRPDPPLAPSAQAIRAALLHLARHGRHEGCAFIVALHQDRTRLESSVLAATADTLTGLGRRRLTWDALLPRWLEAAIPTSHDEKRLGSFSRYLPEAWRDRLGEWLDERRLGAQAHRAWAISMLDQLGGDRTGPLLEGFIADPRVTLSHLWSAARYFDFTDPRLADLYAAAVARPRPQLAPAAEDFLGTHLRRQAGARRVQAARALVEMADPRGMTLLTELATEPVEDPLSLRMRSFAARVLAEVGERRGLELLHAHANDPSVEPQHHREIAEALAALRDPRGVQMLTDQVTSPADADEQQRSAAALLAAGDRWAGEVLAESARRFIGMRNWFQGRDDDDSIVALTMLRQAAAESLIAAKAMVEAGDPRGNAALVELGETPEIWPFNRLEAEKALVEHGDPRGVELLAAHAAETYPPYPGTRVADTVSELYAANAAEALIEAGDPRGRALLAAREELDLGTKRKQGRGRLRADLLTALPTATIGLLLGAAFAGRDGWPAGWSIGWLAGAVNLFGLAVLGFNATEFLWRRARRRGWAVRSSELGPAMFQLLLVLPALTLLGYALVPTGLAGALWHLFQWRAP